MGADFEGAELCDGFRPSPVEGGATIVGTKGPTVDCGRGKFAQMREFDVF